MTVFRPKNLNKRSYSQNANVIGPVTQPSCSSSSSQCYSTSNVVESCSGPNFILGCCCTYCYCCCYDVCCACTCTLTNYCVPGGMWSIKEQFNYKKQDKWKNAVCSTTGTPSIVSCTNYGALGCTGAQNCYGFYAKCSGGCRYFVAPVSTSLFNNWNNRCNAVSRANSVVGSVGWYYPGEGDLSGTGGYWDCLGNGCCASWADGSPYPGGGRKFQWPAGQAYNEGATAVWETRAFRKVAV